MKKRLKDRPQKPQNPSDTVLPFPARLVVDNTQPPTGKAFWELVLKIIDDECGDDGPMFD